MKSIRMLHHSDAFLFTEPQKANIGTLLWICGTFLNSLFADLCKRNRIS